MTNLWMGRLILFKSLDLGVLSFFYPWTDRLDIGKGVLQNRAAM